LSDIYEIEYEDMLDILDEDTSYEDYYLDQEERYSFSPDWSNISLYTEYWIPERNHVGAEKKTP